MTTKHTHSFGESHAVKIGKVKARQFCGMYPMPDVGYEVIVAITSDDTFSAFKHRLMVQNISGEYWLCSSSVSREEWPVIFKVQA